MNNSKSSPVIEACHLYERLLLTLEIQRQYLLGITASMNAKATSEMIDRFLAMRGIELDDNVQGGHSLVSFGEWGIDLPTDEKGTLWLGLADKGRAEALLNEIERVLGDDDADDELPLRARRMWA